MEKLIASNDATLPPKYLAVATVYLETGDYDLAGRAAGYSRASAESRARQVLAMPSVRAYVEAKQRNSDEVTTEEQNKRILDRLNEVLDGNVADFITIDEDGQPTLDFSNATRQQMAAISNVRVKERKIYDRNGRVTGTERSSSFALLDKLRAAELLGKQGGLFKPDEQRVVLDVADRLLAARQRVLAADLDSEKNLLTGGEGTGV